MSGREDEEALRRRLYAPGADADDLLRYSRAAAREEPRADDAVAPRRPSRRLLLLGVAPLAVAAAGIALAASQRGPRARVTRPRPPLPPLPVPPARPAVAHLLPPPAVAGGEQALDAALDRFDEGGRALDDYEEHLIEGVFPGAAADVPRGSAGGISDGAPSPAIPLDRFDPHRGDRFVMTVLSPRPVTVRWTVTGRTHETAQGTVLDARSAGPLRAQVLGGVLPDDYVLRSMRVRVAPQRPFRYRLTLLRTGGSATSSPAQ